MSATIADPCAFHRERVAAEHFAFCPDNVYQVGPLVESGQFWLPVERAFPLDRVADAYRLAEHGHVRGRLVLVTG